MDGPASLTLLGLPSPGQGRGGWDWIVTKWRETGPPNMSQNWITIAELTTRQEREFANK